MPDTNDQILAELRELKHWLYGSEGFEGDISSIKKQYEALCKADKAHDDRLRTLEKVVYGIGLIISVSGVGYGVVKLFGN